MPSIYDHQAMDAFCRAESIDRHRLRRLRNAWFKKFAGRDAALAELLPHEREKFAREVSFHTLTVESEHASQRDRATKLVFRTPAGFLVEAVLMQIASGRTALCLSSQVGCAARCEFCATGKMGIARNLSAAEIVDQVVHAGERLAREGRSLRNLVFMGMGEPLHNEEQLYAALDLLHPGDAFARSPRRTLVSTVGIPDAMERLVERYPAVHLALSLHSARPEVRERLVPLAMRYPLDVLRNTLATITAGGARKVMIEYLLLAGVNDGPDDLAALLDYLHGLPVHVNLIPYNPIAEAPQLAGTPPAEREAFAAALKEAGLTTTIRYSLGADIAAACGQLVRSENRQLARLAHTTALVKASE